MSSSSENDEQEVFVSDLQNGWNDPIKHSWTDTVEHSNELYDIHGVGTVKNFLCLRLFASSLYEIANGSKDSQKMMKTIFGDRLISNIQKHDKPIYESTLQTVQYFSWKIRKAQILVFRRTNENHSWRSVREILVNILSDGSPKQNKIVAGMSATILQDIFRCHIGNLNFREDGSLLPKARFNDVFRVALNLFNDSIEDYVQKEKKEVVYEQLASRLVYFYTRLAADTWRILVVRNGPKVEIEWYMLSGAENNFTDTQNQNAHQSNTSNSLNQPLRQNQLNNTKSLFSYRESVSHASFINQIATYRPIRKY